MKGKNIFQEKETHKYDDIIHLPHHVSTKHPQMALSDRAAQFSPFAALTGHEDSIRETARRTEAFLELDEDKKEQLEESRWGLCYASWQDTENRYLSAQTFI